MGRQENYETPEENDEEMTVTLDLDDGTSVTCAIVTILTVNNRDYIVLLPLEEDGENHDGEVWFYRYSEDENDPNAEPVLDYIDSDEEYDQVAEAFDEYLDNAEFDEIMDDSTWMCPSIKPGAMYCPAASMTCVSGPMQCAASPTSAMRPSAMATSMPS